jgi:hypothetical protein
MGMEKLDVTGERGPLHLSNRSSGIIIITIMVTDW